MASSMCLWSPRSALRVGVRHRPLCSRGVSTASAPSLRHPGATRQSLTASSATVWPRCRQPRFQSLVGLGHTRGLADLSDKTQGAEKSASDAEGDKGTAQGGQSAGKGEAAASSTEENEIAEDGEIPPEVADLFDTLRGEALRRLDEFGPIHLFSLCWAYSTARLLDEDLHKQVTGAAIRLGRKRDEEARHNGGKKNRDRAGRDGRFKEKSQGSETTASGSSELAEATPSGSLPPAEINTDAPAATTIPQSEQPYVVAEGKHWMALYKPPFWLVSVDSKEAMKAAAATPFEDEDEGDADDDLAPERERKRPRVHKWIWQNLADKYPVCTDAIEAFGLLHRLDVQTSGILICAKSYVGAYWLRLQWCSYTVDKEYICLVHGWVDPSEREIHKRIRIDKKKAENSRRTISTHCSISPSGKPSYTELVTLARFVRPASDAESAGEPLSEGDAEPAPKEEQRYSLVALKLHTGRTHQIRVHMMSIGHPLVCDSKYAEDRFRADRMWCTRNFLHTYRIGFEDTPDGEDEVNGSRLVNLLLPLPQDLRDCLGTLQPVDDASKQHCEDWLSDDRRRLRPFEKLAEEIHGPDPAVEETAATASP